MWNALLYVIYFPEGHTFCHLFVLLWDEGILLCWLWSIQPLNIDLEHSTVKVHGDEEFSVCILRLGGGYNNVTFSSFQFLSHGQLVEHSRLLCPDDLVLHVSLHHFLALWQLNKHEHGRMQTLLEGERIILAVCLHTPVGLGHRHKQGAIFDWSKEELRVF